MHYPVVTDGLFGKSAQGFKHIKFRFQEKTKAVESVKTKVALDIFDRRGARGVAENLAAVYRNAGGKDRAGDAGTASAANHFKLKYQYKSKLKQNGGNDPLRVKIKLKLDVKTAARIAAGGADPDVYAYNLRLKIWVKLDIRYSQARGGDTEAWAALDNAGNYLDENGEIEIRSDGAEPVSVAPDSECSGGRTVSLEPGESLTLVNGDTGELIGVSEDEAGNLRLDYNTSLDTAGGRAITLEDGETIYIETANGGIASIAAGTGNDWTVDASGLSGAEVIVDGVGYGSDHVNLVNVDTGEESSYWLGCLIQEDTLATSGDDVATIRVQNGQSVRVNGADGRDQYRITAGETIDWNIVRADGNRGWFFYTGNDVVNVRNTATGKTTSFQLGADGSLTQLDDIVTEGENITSYDFTPGTDFNIQPGGHNKAVTYRISARDDGDWTVVCAQGSPMEMIAAIGEGDVIKVIDTPDTGPEERWFKLEDGALVEYDTKPETADDATTYRLNPGDTLRIRATGEDADLTTVTGRGTRKTAPPPAAAANAANAPARNAPAQPDQAAFYVQAAFEFQFSVWVTGNAAFSAPPDTQIAAIDQAEESMLPFEFPELPDWVEMLLEKLREYIDKFYEEVLGDETVGARIASIYRNLNPGADFKEPAAIK